MSGISGKTAVRLLCLLALAGAALAATGIAHAALRSGALINGDATQTGRIVRTGVPSTCATPRTNPGLFPGSTPRTYDAYTFTNTSGSAACIHITLDQKACVGIHVVAYLGSFNTEE